MVLNPLLFSFLFNSSVPSVASGNLLGWLLGPFDMRPVVFDNFLCIWYDKLFKTYLASFLPSPEISIFPQSLFSFSGKLYHKNTVWVPGSFTVIATGLVNLPRPFSGQRTRLWIHRIQIHTAVFLCNFFYVMFIHIPLSHIKNPRFQGHRRWWNWDILQWFICFLPQYVHNSLRIAY